MFRKENYNIELVLSKIKSGNKKESQVDFDGDLIYMNNIKFQMFLEKGTKCVCCGLEGKYFIKERHRIDVPYCLNLYGINGDEETLLNCDHIIPRSKGGSDTLLNLQPMCVKCNRNKSDKI